MKERGLLLYVCFTLLVASRERMGFKRGVTTRFTMVRREESAEYWRAYIRRRTMEILDKYYNLEESDFWVSPGGKVKMVGEKRVKAADWVYKKYGILNPRPTFTRIQTEHGEIYRVECPPEWEPDVLFLPLHFGVVRVPLVVPLPQRIGRAIMERVVSAMPIMMVLMGKGSPVFHYFKYEDFTEIINAKDEGIVGDGVTDDTNNIETLFTNFAGRVIFFPRSTYIVNGLAAPDPNVEGPNVPADTTIIGEGNGTLFNTTQDGLQFFWLTGDNVRFKDLKIEGTGIVDASSDGAGFSGQNRDGVMAINVTSESHIGENNVNARGVSIVGTSIGALVQDCRLNSNQHGIVMGAPNPLVGVRVVSCYASDSIEKNYYSEGQQHGTIMISNVADGAGNGAYFYFGTDSRGATITGNSFLCDGNGIEPYTGAAFACFNTTWADNIAQTGSNGAYPQSSLSVYTGNVITYNTLVGFYAFTRFQYNIIDNNVISYNTLDGIYIANDDPENEWKGNLVVDNAGLRGIWLRGGNYQRLQWNRVYSTDSGVYHRSYGLDIDVCTHTYLRGNDLRSAGNVIYRDNQAATTIWAGDNLTMDW